MEEIKTCRNCKYFEKHYFINGKMRLSECIYCGSCLYSRSKDAPRKYLIKNTCCEHWEQAELIPVNYHKQAKECLREIEKRIRNISLILNMDDETLK